MEFAKPSVRMAQSIRLLEATLGLAASTSGCETLLESTMSSDKCPRVFLEKVPVDLLLLLFHAIGDI